MRSRSSHSWGPLGTLDLTRIGGGEPAEDVTEFFVLHANVPDRDIREHLVLQLGLEWDIQNDLMIWTRGWVKHPYGVDAPDSERTG
jgi:hypothetical protein